MARGLETVNISKAATTTNMFYLFFHGGKAAIVPFLTLFFRLVGLTPLEAGLIIAARTVVGLVWAPLWARCASAFSRHRFVLMLSLFAMLMTYLTLPALYTQVARQDHCQPGNLSLRNDSGVGEGAVQPWLDRFFPSHDDQSNAAEATTTPVSATSSSKPHPSSSPKEPSHLPTEETVTAEANDTPEESTPASLSEENTDMPPATPTSAAIEELYRLLTEIISKSDLKNLTAESLYEQLQNQTNGHFTEEQAERLYNIWGRDHEVNKRAAAAAPSDETENESKNQFNAEIRRFGNRVSDGLVFIQTTLQKDKLLLFLVILAVVVGGEIFASPVEKVADDSWFDFLNRIDDLERYGQQRFWGSMAFVIVPITVGIAVTNTPCFLTNNLHHFLLHFYVFAVCTCGALMVAVCYPVPPPSGGRTPNRMCKSMSLAFCDCRGFFFSLTLLLTGALYASYHNFLLWRVQDLGGSEMVMGFCVSLAAFGEIPMLIFSNLLVKRMGHSNVASLALLVLALRLLAYAFIPVAWAIAPIELTHGLTHTSLWFAVLSHEDFSTAGPLDRSLRTILSSLYFGVGFAVGSILSGYIYYVYGASQLFWGGSALVGAWLIIFTLVQRCLPKKEKIRYVKLLRSDSDNSDEDDEDWLEMALKER